MTQQDKRRFAASDEEYETEENDHPPPEMQQQQHKQRRSRKKKKTDTSASPTAQQQGKPRSKKRQRAASDENEEEEEAEEGKKKYRPDTRTEAELLADPVIQNALNRGPIPVGGFVTGWEDLNVPAAEHDPAVHRPPPDTPGFIDRSQDVEDGGKFAWRCKGPDACGDVWSGSEMKCCPSCGKQRTDMEQHRPVQRAADWDLEKNSYLVFIRNPNGTLKGCINKTDRKNPEGKRWNSYVARREGQIKATFPNLSEANVKKMLSLRHPGTFTSKTEVIESYNAEKKLKQQELGEPQQKRQTLRKKKVEEEGRLRRSGRRKKVRPREELHQGIGSEDDLQERHDSDGSTRMDDTVIDLTQSPAPSPERPMSPQHEELFAAESPQHPAVKQEDTDDPVFLHQEPVRRQNSVAPKDTSSGGQDRPIPGIKDKDALVRLEVIYFAGQHRGLLEDTRTLEVAAFVRAQDWLTDDDDRLAFLEVAAAVLLHVGRASRTSTLGDKVQEEDVSLAKSLARMYMAEEQMTMATLIRWLLNKIRIAKELRGYEEIN